MMFACCSPILPEDTQIALILKILSGFSIAEIASAFFTSKEAINKRLVRGRKQLRTNQFSTQQSLSIEQNLDVVLKTIFLLFNEGYQPSQKKEVLHFDLCLEAIRLTQILVAHPLITKKADAHALLSLMYFNVARFAARINTTGELLQLEEQDRSLWDQATINQGIHHLEEAAKGAIVSKYLLLANISAQHCVAPNYQATNWISILSLYDNLLIIENAPFIRLNRAIALAKVKGSSVAISQIHSIRKESDLDKHHLLHTSLGELYSLEQDYELALYYYKKALKLSKNERDIHFIQKKINALVPISGNRL